mmetsp:Transcript_6713/g.17076  ORF Transcript_6713/g.17076 Transcript_6713/m.17076 type:complete len:223 (-) Transcript_6713:639-1307(-)
MKLERPDGGYAALSGRWSSGRFCRKMCCSIALFSATFELSQSLVSIGGRNFTLITVSEFWSMLHVVFPQILCAPEMTTGTIGTFACIAMCTAPFLNGICSLPSRDRVPSGNTHIPRTSPAPTIFPTEPEKKQRSDRFQPSAVTWHPAMLASASLFACVTLAARFIAWIAPWVSFLLMKTLPDIQANQPMGCTSKARFTTATVPNGIVLEQVRKSSDDEWLAM